MRIIPLCRFGFPHTDQVCNTRRNGLVKDRLVKEQASSLVHFRNAILDNF